MGTIVLTPPVAATSAVAGTFSTAFTTLQTVINGNLDQNNFAAGKIFDLTKLMTGAGLTGYGLRFDGTNWVPVSPEMAYVEFTSNVTVFGNEGAPNDVVSAGAVTFDGSTKVKIEFYASAVQTSTTAGDSVNFSLWDGTDLGRLGFVLTPAAAVMQMPVKLERVLTPSAGSHTYKIRAWRVTANGTVYAGAGGVATQLPGFIRISRT